MESLDRSKEKELKDKRLTNRLRLATTRVKDAERERGPFGSKCTENNAKAETQSL